MKGLTALLLATALALFVTASSGAIRSVSWADSQHGWMAGCGLDNPCVVSTENGGRT